MEKIMEYDQLIDELIKSNIKNRNRMEEFVKSVNAFIWASEFCTVSCDIGRGVGKTNYIRSHATLNDLIIVKRKNLEKIYRQYCFTQNAYTIEDFLDEKTRGMAFKNIYVDDASAIFSSNSKRDFYRMCLLDGKEHTFILLG